MGKTKVLHQLDSAQIENISDGQPSPCELTFGLKLSQNLVNYIVAHACRSFQRTQIYGFGGSQLTGKLDIPGFVAMAN